VEALKSCAAGKRTPQLQSLRKRGGDLPGRQRNHLGKADFSRGPERGGDRRGGVGQGFQLVLFLTTGSSLTRAKRQQKGGGRGLDELQKSALPRGISQFYWAVRYAPTKREATMAANNTRRARAPYTTGIVYRIVRAEGQETKGKWRLESNGWGPGSAGLVQTPGGTNREGKHHGNPDWRKDLTQGCGSTM